MSHSPGASPVTPAASVSNDAAAPGQLSPELKAKWIAALRSNYYEQGHGQLVRNGRYCCLGVYASINGVPDGVMADSSGVAVVGRAWCLAEIPENARYKLAAMNDNGKSFAKIADWIEANL